MIDYSAYKDNEEFMSVLNYLRENCIATEDEVYDGLDLEENGPIEKYYALAQAIVAEEIEMGVIHDPLGADVAYEFMDYLEDLDVEEE